MNYKSHSSIEHFLKLGKHWSPFISTRAQKDKCHLMQFLSDYIFTYMCSPHGSCGMHRQNIESCVKRGLKLISIMFFSQYMFIYILLSGGDIIKHTDHSCGLTVALFIHQDCLFESKPESDCQSSPGIAAAITLVNWCSEGTFGQCFLCQSADVNYHC